VRVAIVGLSLILALGIAFAQDSATGQQEQQVLELIHLKYLNAATVVQIFGGSIISPGVGYVPLQGGVGIVSPGSRIGGLYGDQPYGGYRDARMGRDYRRSDYGRQPIRPYGSYCQGQGDTGYDVDVRPYQQ
jgi:hypothetical protein